MRTRDFTDLLILAALWGASFLFMRIAAPQFGPVPLVELRTAIAAAMLLPLLILRGEVKQLLKQPASLVLLGVTNSALPFALLAFTTLTLSAGFAGILNSTAPLWTAFIGWAWLKNRIAGWQWLGLGLGVIGVAPLVWDKVGIKGASSPEAVLLAVSAAMIATACYGFAANYTRSRLSDSSALALATGSQLGAAAVLLLPAIYLWPTQLPSMGAWLCALALGVFCTGLAYLLFFRLMARVGAVRAAAVAFLIPVFANLWGVIFLNESVSAHMLMGGAVVLLGTALTMGLIKLPGAKAALGAAKAPATPAAETRP